MRKTTKMVAVLAAMSVMVLGAATMVSAAEKNGWAKEGSDWYYYVEDKAVKNQWALSGDQWYFLDDDGKMATDVFVDNSIPEVVDVREYDPSVIADEVLYGDIYDYYYVKEDGAMATDWANVKWLDEVSPVEGDKKAWFYFGANGIMYANTWVLSNDVWYFLGDTGKMLSNDLLLWDNEAYYLNKDGAMVTGWYKVQEDNKTDSIYKNEWLYADKNGALASDGWKKVNNSWYYFGEYLTNTKGATEDGFVGGLIVSGPAVVRSPYTMESNGFFNIDQVRDSAKKDNYYLKASGAMETGLFKISYIDGTTRVNKYYFAKSNGTLQNGVQEVSGKYFLFDTNTYERFEGPEKYAVDGVATDYPNDSAAKTALKSMAKGTVIHKLGTATKWTR